jgi:hypothetical protein
VIRLLVLVEGPSEQSFVNNILSTHLAPFGVSASATSVETSRERRRPDRTHRGGVVTYQHVKRHLHRLMSGDPHDDVRFTTMFDLYALPDDFPGYPQASEMSSPVGRALRLEADMADDIADQRLVPYIQVHEFEALLLTDPSKFAVRYPDRSGDVLALATEIATAGEPEEIDDGPASAPSKRIARFLPRYADEKPEASSVIAAAIGIPAMRARCPHFNAWLTQLEALAQP